MLNFDTIAGHVSFIVPHFGGVAIGVTGAEFAHLPYAVCVGPGSSLPGWATDELIKFFPMSRSVYCDLIQKCLDIFKGGAADDAIAGGDTHPAIGIVKCIDQPSDLGTHFVRCGFLEYVLDIKSSKESDKVSVLFGNRDFIHGAFLDRVENGYPSLN